MIKQILSLRPLGGKTQEARQFGKEMCDFINKTYPNVTAEVYAERFGDIGTLNWIIRYDNLGHLDETATALEASEEYQARVAKGQGLFVEGSAKIKILQTY